MEFLIQNSNVIAALSFPTLATILIAGVKLASHEVNMSAKQIVLREEKNHTVAA